VPRREWRLRIEDMLERISTIQEYVHGLGRADFAASSMVVGAVLHNLTIIGEAASHVPADIVAQHPDIRLRPIRAMRNVLAHRYFGVDLDLVWERVASDLPALRTQLEQLLREVRPDEDA